MEGLRAEEANSEEKAGANVDRLLRSALDDVTSKSKMPS
jgi:hypothetical protein